MNERLYRSRNDRMVAGVAGGLAEIWNLDPSIVRIVWAVLVPLTGFIALLVCVVMAIVVPEEDESAWVPPPVSPANPSAPQAPASVAAGSSSAAVGDVTPETTSAETGPAPATRAEWRTQRRADRAARRAERGPGSGAMVLGVALVLLGAYFLLREYVPAFDFDRVWPVALIAFGVLLLIVALGRRPGSGGTPG